MLIQKIRKSVFLRAQIYFLCILTLVCCVVISIGVRGRNDLERQIIHAMDLKTRYYVDYLEQELQSFENVLSSFLTDPDMSYFIFNQKNPYDYEGIQALRNIYSKIGTLSSSFIDRITLYSDVLGREITFTSNFPNAPFTVRKYKDLDKVQYTALCNEARKSTGIISRQQDGLFMFFTPINSINLNTDFKYLISLKISEAAIANFLQSLNEYQRGGIVIGSVDGNFDIYTDEYKELHQLYTNQMGKYIKVKNSEIRHGKYTYISQGQFSDYLNAGVFMFVDKSEVFQTPKLYDIIIIVFTLFIALVLICSLIWIKKRIEKPFQVLLNAFDSVKQGEIDTKIEIHKEDEFTHLYHHFNIMNQEILRLIEEVYEQELHAKTAELKQLQYQINPHFLYNSMYILGGLAETGNTGLIVEMTGHLTKYYRYITISGAGDVELFKEVEQVREYIAIQNIRYSGLTESIISEIPDPIREIKVPGLILQPLVENVYKHGFKFSSGKKLLKVSFKHDKSFLSVFVENTGHISDDEIREMQVIINAKSNKAEKNGVLNVHRRVNIKYGKDSGLFLSRSELGGLCAELRINRPLLAF